VYRSTASGTAFQKLVFTKQLSFTDSAVANTTVYYYVVTAVAANGAESVYSNQAVATIP
jgi:fibronectin type 3 domain-containing protein